jgi:hypothetical protein
VIQAFVILSLKNSWFRQPGGIVKSPFLASGAQAGFKKGRVY